MFRVRGKLKTETGGVKVSAQPQCGVFQAHPPLFRATCVLGRKTHLAWKREREPMGFRTS